MAPAFQSPAARRRTASGVLRTLLLSMAVLAGSCEVRQPGDVRPEATTVLERAGRMGQVLTLADLVGDGLQPESVLQQDLPGEIRLWRRRDGDGGSCTGRVEVIALEDYVKGVLPHEWIASWEEQALDAGAVTIRTYASFWSAVGGKYACADLDDTTWSQVYEDSRDPRTDEAADRTRGQVATLEGALVYAEYSAENTGITAHGVVDSPCEGRGQKGHGRGVCQWGTQRWAELDKDPQWILQHYYPGVSVGRLDEVERAETLAARLRRRPDPIRIERDSIRVLTLIATNLSSEPWAPGSMHVGTADGNPSAVRTQVWLTESMVVRNSERVASGARARFDVPIQAGQRDQSIRLALFDAQGRRSAKTWDLTIRVTSPSTSTPWFVGGGAVFGVLIAGGLIGLRRWRRGRGPT